MKEIKNILEERAQYLQGLKRKKEQELLDAPEGSLRVCNRGGRPQYYERNNPKDFCGVYIREKDISIAQTLAQKDYDKKVLQASEKGERVRSKSEIIIANLLNKQGIPYRYEYPVYLSGWGKVYPDFTLLNVRERKEIYWEHLGRMSDADYAEMAIQKIALYEQNNIFIGDKLILTFETQNHPLNQKHIFTILNRFFN